MSRFKELRSRRRARFTAAALCVAVGALATSCRQPPKATVVNVDLVRHFRLARGSVETLRIDFGTPESRRLLVSGWSKDRHDEKRDSTFVINTRDQAVIALDVVSPRDLVLVIECRPFGGTPPRLTFQLNGKAVGGLDLSRRLQTYRLEIPAEALVSGRNLLRIDHQQTGEKDRTARVQWHSLAFDGHSAPAPPPIAHSDRNLIFLPFGTRLDYLVELPSGSLLSAEGWRFRGDSGGHLEVVLETDEDGSRSLASITPGGGGDVALGTETRFAARLSLRAVADGAVEPQDGVAIVGPVVRSPASVTPGATGTAAPVGTPSGRPPNIIVYMIDTLRADHLGCYGYAKPTSPNIDAFAADATLYERGIGQSSWTRASVASLFTGMWPGAHGAIGRRDRLVDEADTLAEVLRRVGYTTAGIVSNPNVYRTFGVAQGFDAYYHLPGRKPPSAKLNEAAFSWLEANADNAPLFLYLHTIDPHNPYLPPEPHFSRFAAGTDETVERIRATRRTESWETSDIEALTSLYDAEIAANDESFGELLEFLRRTGLYEDTVLVVVTDHGEEFYEHRGWTHGKNLHHETLDMALIIKFPGQGTGERRSEPVGHLDLMPTLLDLAGAEIPPQVEGRSLVRPVDSAARGASASGSPAIFAHLHLDGARQISVVHGDWKLILRWSRDGTAISHRALFDTAGDPHELNNLAAERPILTEFLESKIAAKLLDQAYVLTSEEAAIDPEVERSLRALGYLQ